MMNANSIEVFQELRLKRITSREAVREALLRMLERPWSHLADREEEVSTSSAGDDDVLVFGREEVGDAAPSVLLLWSDKDGYKVVNIVPAEIGSLGITNYNAILRDFSLRVAEPAARGGAFEVELSTPYESIGDWVDKDVAVALERFSRMANKSTGNSHPRDKDRWCAFLITAHKSARRLDSEMLMRWLIELEGWPADTAQGLAIDYEFGLELLSYYDNEL